MKGFDMSGSHIAVVGIGAIGGSIAADLLDLGRHDLQLCTRTPFKALEVRHPAGVSRVEATVVTEPSNAHPVDWVLLATKAHQSAGATPWFEQLRGPNTVVVVLQNGVDHEERIAPLLPNGMKILPVVVQVPAEKHAAGKIEQMHSGTLIVPDCKTGHDFAALFEGARTNINISDDFTTQAWWKLLNNAALGGVCALVLRKNGIAADPEIRSLILELMGEVLAVGRAEGAKLPDDAPEKALRMVLAAAPGHWSSITADRRAGRKLEWQARNAVVGARGRKHGIATPLNDVITTLLRAADDGLA
jgi:2-dehydropantoate 2-reductase